MVAHLGAAVRVVLLAAVAFPWFVGCRDTALETETCFETANKAGDAVEPGGWQVTDEYRRFANTVTRQGAIFGVPFNTEHSEFLERSYASISGTSPYKNPKSAEAYRVAFYACATATPETDDDKYDPFAEPPEASRPIILCVAEAVYSVEQKARGGHRGLLDDLPRLRLRQHTPR